MENKRKKLLENQLSKIREELGSIRDAERLTENKEFVGKFFKYHNCYSCPKKKSDYWWLYMNVTDCTQEGYLKTWSFQIDQYGKIDIDFSDDTTVSDGYMEITPREFWMAWANLMKRLNAINHESK